MAVRRLDWTLVISGCIVLSVVLMGVVAPFVDYAPEDAVDYGKKLLGPSLDNPLGTDAQGRDVAMRLFKGTEAFFFPALLAAFVAAGGGGMVGAFSGYSQGWLQKLALGSLQLLDTLPRLVFIILVCAILEPEMWLIALVAGSLFIPVVATMIRRRVEDLASEDYILAYIAHGFRPTVILLYHVLWLQCRSILLRQGAYVFGYVLFVETALSYLGDYGVQEPVPSWGNMVAQARDLAGLSTLPWLVPALAIVATIGGVIIFGNTLAVREERERR